MCNIPSSKFNNYNIWEFDTLYHVKIWVAINLSDNDFIKNFSKDDLEIFNSDKDSLCRTGLTSIVKKGHDPSSNNKIIDYEYTGVLINFINLEQYNDYSTYTHEAVHGGIEIFNYCECTILENENSEPLAYLIEYIFDCILNAVNQYKKLNVKK